MTVERIAVPLIDHRLKPEQVLEREKTAQAACEKALGMLLAIPDAKRSFVNTVEAIEQATASYVDTAARLGILKDVHTDPAVRDASATVEERSGTYLVGLASRRDLYQAVKAYVAGPGKAEKLDPEQKRLLELTLRDFRRNGLELPDDKLEQLVALRSRLTELSTQFQKNLNENADAVEVSGAELDGLPPAFVERLQKTPKGTWAVTTKYPDYFPFMENAKSGEARKRLYAAFQSREAARNTPMLAEALALRDQQARLLGYKSHADFVTEDRMAKSAGKVRAFLDDLRVKLKPLRDANFARMLELKRAETGDAQARLEPWDASYYLNQIKKRDYALDGEKVREFFPLETVVAGMLGVYGELFGITMQRVKEADVWAPEVALYEVRDTGTGAYVGRFYTDFYPRQGKYGHAAVAGVAVARKHGTHYDSPMAVLMANFNPPGKDRPSLLSFEEVETLFHEFGHVMHQTLTTARYGSMSGTSVARDFVEAPSQMLENWVYEKAVLDRLSGHYQDAKKKLPGEIVAKLRETRSFDSGWRYTRQVFLATYDLTVHTSGAKVDPDAVDSALYGEILGLEPLAGTHFPATFGHLMGGYDAGYYGYLWSEVFADDMFSKFEKAGIFNGELGRRYRSIILARGKGEEPDALLKEFLGREPNADAFLRNIGLKK